MRKSLHLLIPGWHIFAATSFAALDHPDWLFDAWRTEDGLPENTVNAIEQTPDGYLWLATFNGLARFDGRRFVVFDAANTPPLKSSRIHQLHLDAQGRLWSISEFGHLTCVVSNQFTEFGPAQGLAAPAVVMQEDAEGRLWVDTQNEKFHFFNGKFFHGSYSNYLTVDQWPVPPGESEPPPKTNWNPNKARFRPGYMARVTYPRTEGEGRTIGSADGGIWIVNRQVQKFREGQWVRVMTPPEPIRGVGSLCEDRQGNFWVGTWEQGLFCFSPLGEFHKFKLTDSPTHWPVRKILEDREGNLWIGSGGDGLWRLKPRAISTLGHRAGLRSEVVRSIAEDRSGKVWICNLGGIDWFTPEKPRLATNSHLQIPIPWSILTDRSGRVMITTYEAGIYRHQEGKLAHLADHLPQAALQPRFSHLNVIYEDRKGDIHVGSGNGHFRMQGSQVLPGDTPLGDVVMDVRAMGEDHLGNFYLGLNGGGLLRGKDGLWTHWTQKQGLVSDHIWSLYVDAENTVWIGTVGKGLSRFRDGKFFNFNAPHLLLPRLITSILEDDHGALWFGSQQGIFRAPRENLNAFADGKTGSLNSLQFGIRDGMGSSECVGSRQPSACKTRDGRLWFPTVKGVCIVDPKKLPFNPQPPAVMIEEVIADGERIASGSGQKHVQIPTGRSRLEVHFTGLSLAAPEKVRFKYRLDGFDQHWVESGTLRVAHYTRVPPGRYNFRVIAANADGVWNEAGAGLALVVVPVWWQTLWFRSSISAVAILLLAGAYYLRMRWLQQSKREQEDFSSRLIAFQERERQRVAAELHDGLGQSLLVIKSQAILAGRKVEIETDTADRLKDLSEMAAQAISEVRSIAHDLRPFHLDQLGLTRAVRGMLSQVTNSAGLQLAHDLADVDKAFPPEMEINFFRMAQELTNNIVKHAQATAMKVVLTRSAGEVVLQVEDNGRGFDAPNRGGEGFGLRNVAERVRIMEGKWNIRSEPGQGTTVEIRLPISIKVTGVLT